MHVSMLSLREGGGAFEFLEKFLFKILTMGIEIWIKYGQIAPPQSIYLLFESLKAAIKQVL